MSKLGVIGAGAWGTALALAAARAGHEVALCGRDPALIERMRERRENMRHLPGVRLPEALLPTVDPADLMGADPVLLAVPAQAVRAALALAPPAARLVICAKGLERASGLRLSQVAASVRPSASCAVLSGPSYAAELARDLPTAVALAAAEMAHARELARCLSGAAFRLYPGDDLAGVEIGGALKNVVAIAAGAVMGLDLGENARAAVVTRGLAEIARLALALGARRETLLGLSGVGDLLLTATSLTSRNTRLGFELGRGRAVGELTAAGQPLAEGAWTAAAACALAAAQGLELPICRAVMQVVDGDWTVREAVDALLRRPPPEQEFFFPD